MKTKRMFLIGLLIYITAGIIPVFGSDEAPAQPGGRIAFIANFQGDYDLYVINPDGSGMTQLTATPENEYEPQWSPDGTKILFRTIVEGRQNLYAIDADGTNLVQLDTGADYYDSVSWSPDGSRILYFKNRGRSDEIHLIGADGSDRIILAMDKEKPHSPSWSPDGAKIIMVLNQDIYLCDADGGNRTCLSQERGSYAIPSMSPDGTKVAYYTSRPLDMLGLKSGMFVMNVDGSAPQRLYRCDNASKAAWSPDGKFIAFVSKTGEQRDSRGDVTNECYALHVIDVETKKAKTYNCPGQTYFRWSPDGTRLAYASPFGLTIVNLDGRSKNAVITGGTGPSWAPDGTRFCYIKVLPLLKTCLCLANADGGGQVELTEGKHRVHSAVWSPR